MIYQVKRLIPPLGKIFKKPAQEELFGETNSIEIAGRLLAKCPFYADERCVILNTVTHQVVAVKERRVL